MDSTRQSSLPTCLGHSTSEALGVSVMKFSREDSVGIQTCPEKKQQHCMHWFHGLKEGCSREPVISFYCLLACEQSLSRSIGCSLHRYLIDLGQHPRGVESRSATADLYSIFLFWTNLCFNFQNAFTFEGKP